MIDFDRKILADSVCDILGVFFDEYLYSRKRNLDILLEYGDNEIITKASLKNLDNDKVLWEADFLACKTISDFTSKIGNFENFCIAVNELAEKE
ncbi:hypothetical protein OFO01_07375 [Campylobacter sp. JMF_01 NE2]|nr:hypothetical protein [Campylobacter sp. JMF_03 NE3]MDA3053215.1 hypothetical protein [Campylobacter sp. JMF_03 NE3]MDA3067602.1 hypothetical protein [Campylobacter sp. JMF_01 NE2]